MLTWEQNTPTAAVPPPFPTPLDRQDSEPAMAPAAPRRVRASDKRIINGQTDVNQLVPFKY